MHVGDAYDQQLQQIFRLADQEEASAGWNPLGPEHRDDLYAFWLWCAENGRQPMPAEPQTIVDFLTYEVYVPPPKFYRAVRVRRSIRAAHILAGHVPTPTNDPLVAQSVKDLRQRPELQPRRRQRQGDPDGG